MAVSKLMHRWAEDGDPYSRQVACGNRRKYAANGTSDPAKVTCPRCLAVATHVHRITTTKEDAMLPTTFQISTEKVFDGFQNGTRWNGFLNVWVTPETRDAIVAHLEELNDAPEGIADLRALPVEDGLVSLAYGYATTEVVCGVCEENAPVTTERDGIPCCDVCAEAWDESPINHKEG